MKKTVWWQRVGYHDENSLEQSGIVSDLNLVV